MPCVAAVGGEPEITGARFPEPAGAVTVIENGASAAVAVPSLTEIAMLANVPVAVGVPDNRPVAASNEPQAGRFVTENVNAFPSGSLAVGVNV
jgi:hypothetical protein